MRLPWFITLHKFQLWKIIFQLLKHYSILTTKSFIFHQSRYSWPFFFSPSLIFFFLNFNWRLITLQYCSGFCHTLTWISHGCACIPHPEPPSHLPLHLIPQGHPSAPALSTLSHASNLDWWSVSRMIIYMFQCYSLNEWRVPILQIIANSCSCLCHLCRVGSSFLRLWF